MTSTVLCVLPRHEGTGRGDETTLPTHTHGSVPGYATTYCKGCTHSSMKMKQDDRMLGAYAMTKKGYALKKS
jgi:hypothetical protein